MEADKAKVRLIAGKTGSGDLMAFVQIKLAPGWKTYWRTPGDAGGLPPSFDWSKSSNLARAEVQFPAPERFTDKSGSTIGYKDEVVLPVMLAANDPSAKIALVAGLHYGICKDICIPVEAELAVDVTAADAAPLDAVAEQALDAVPRPQDRLRPQDPVLLSAKADLQGSSPRITIAARFPEGAVDVFLEGQDGLFLPSPNRAGDGADGAVTFETPLGADVDLAALKGKTVTVTLVGAAGSSVATFRVE